MELSQLPIEQLATPVANMRSISKFHVFVCLLADFHFIRLSLTPSRFASLSLFHSHQRLTSTLGDMEKNKCLLE